MQLDLVRYQWIKQGRGDFCIHAAIENVLAYLGESSWSQERIHQAWCNWWSACGRLGAPSFDLESPKKFLPLTELGERYLFKFFDCQRGVAEALLKIQEALAKPAPVPTIASTVRWHPQWNREVAHMWVIVGLEGGHAHYHDPEFTHGDHIALPDLGARIGAKPHLLQIEPSQI